MALLLSIPLRRIPNVAVAIVLLHFKLVYIIYQLE